MKNSYLSWWEMMPFFILGIGLIIGLILVRSQVLFKPKATLPIPTVNISKNNADYFLNISMPSPTNQKVGFARISVVVPDTLQSFSIGNSTSPDYEVIDGSLSGNRYTYVIRLLPQTPGLPQISAPISFTFKPGQTSGYLDFNVADMQIIGLDDSQNFTGAGNIQATGLQINVTPATPTPTEEEIIITPPTGDRCTQAGGFCSGATTCGPNEVQLNYSCTRPGDICCKAVTPTPTPIPSPTSSSCVAINNICDPNAQIGESGSCCKNTICVPYSANEGTCRAQVTSTPTPTSDLTSSLFLTVRFRPIGSTGAINKSIMLQIDQGQPVYHPCFRNAQYNYDCTISNVPAGLHDLYIHYPGYLRRKFASIQIKSGANSLDLSPYPLLGGDFVGPSNSTPDNKLDINDLGAFLSVWTMSQVPNTPQNAIFDLDSDGYLTINDIGEVLSNWTSSVVSGE